MKKEDFRRYFNSQDGKVNIALNLGKSLKTVKYFPFYINRGGDLLLK